MMKTRLKSPRWAIVLGLAVVSMSLLIVAGCSNNPATSGAVDNQTSLDWLNQNFGSEGPSLAPSINIANCVVLYDTTIVQTVNQYGYQMDVIHGAERVGFSLPYMAVSKSVTLKIHVTEYRASFGKFWLLDCGPNGQKFKYPLYVQPNAAARNGSSIVLFYYNPVTRAWEVQEIGKANGNTNPQVPIYHFSKYAIS